MTRKLSDIDKALLADARRREREEARDRGVGTSDGDKGLVADARCRQREEARERGVGGIKRRPR